MTHGDVVDEQVLLARMDAEGHLGGHGYDEVPAAQYASHTHTFDKVLYCVAGSLVFTTPDGELPLTPGDRLDLERGTEHSAVIGPDGARCLEARRAER